MAHPHVQGTLTPSDSNKALQGLMCLCWVPQGSWSRALSKGKGMPPLFCHPCAGAMAKGLNRAVGTGTRDREAEKAGLTGWMWENHPEDQAHTAGPLEHTAGG